MSENDVAPCLRGVMQIVLRRVHVSSPGIALPMTGPLYTMVAIIQGDTNNEQINFDRNDQSISRRNSQL